MPRTYFVCGNYFPPWPNKIDVQRAAYQSSDDYAILVNEQRGDKRTPSGFARIYNALLDCAFADPCCEVAWILGDDVRPTFDCFEKTMKVLLSDPTIGAAYPVEAWHDKKECIVTILPFSPGAEVPLDGALSETHVEQIFAGFACVAIHRGAWSVVGKMDEKIGLGYAEDLDWGIRCWKAGFRIVNVRNAYFLHARGATFNRLIKDGVLPENAPYEAAARCKEKWPWLWNGEPPEETMGRLRGWYHEARGDAGC